MPNWAVGTIKLRGSQENIMRFLVNELYSEKPIEYLYEDHRMRMNAEDLVWIKKARRTYIDNLYIECFFDEEGIEVLEIDNLNAAWGVSADDYVKMSIDYNLDIKIFVFESGAEFTQEVEIIKGEITKNQTIEYDDYNWDVPFSNLGG